MTDQLKNIQPVENETTCNPYAPNRLPTVTLDNGKTYFIDERLKQLRNTVNPHDYIDF